MLAPKAMGRRIDEYGLANTCPGRVIDGMKLVMALSKGLKIRRVFDGFSVNLFAQQRPLFALY